MGTNVLFTLDAPQSERARLAFDNAVDELGRLERIFSRFDASSELRELERRRVIIGSEELIEVVELAIDARRRSGGRFDPTILPSLRALGYDRSIEHVRGTLCSGAVLGHEAGTIAIDHPTGLVALGEGVALDLGGIAKGWIADRIATQLAATAPALVDAGGDISCTPRVGGLPWTVEVAGVDETTFLELTAGGIATSGIDRRRWRGPLIAGRDRHHVVDPRTGESADTDLLRVTVVAGSCATAEVAATSMLVGSSGALETLGTAYDVAWLAVPTDPTQPHLRSRGL